MPPVTPTVTPRCATPGCTCHGQAPRWPYHWLPAPTHLEPLPAEFTIRWPNRAA